MSQENLMCGVDFIPSRVDYSYCNSSNNSYSVIDHFVMSESLFCDIVDYYSICDEIDNQSDHAPIIMSLKYNIERKTIPHKFEERTCWRKSGLNDIDTYKLNLDYILYTLNVPFDCIKCDDYLCTNTKHHDDVQYFHDRIISACTQAATDIPKTSQSSNIPGWNMHVEESKKTLLFWHDLWRINGSPRQGTIADIMRHTPDKYHYAIRYVKSMSETLKNKQWLEQFLKTTRENYGKK